MASTQVSNFRAAIALESFVLVGGTLVMANSWALSDIGAATFIVTYQILCALVAGSRLTVAALMIAIPNFLMAALTFVIIIDDGPPRDPGLMLWLVCTSSIVLVSMCVMVLASMTDNRNIDDV